MRLGEESLGLLGPGMNGRVGVIGLEYRFMGIYDREGVREKLVWLLNRLSVLLAEDGRKATTVNMNFKVWSILKCSTKDLSYKLLFSTLMDFLSGCIVTI